MPDEDWRIDTGYWPGPPPEQLVTITDMWLVYPSSPTPAFHDVQAGVTLVDEAGKRFELPASLPPGTYYVEIAGLRLAHVQVGLTSAGVNTGFVDRKISTAQQRLKARSTGPKKPPTWQQRKRR